MDIDDPLKPEFASWRSYFSFAFRVRRSRRYVLDAESQAFLSTVRVMLDKRESIIRKGAILCRAQNGVEYVEEHDDDGNVINEIPTGYSAERMKPLANRAREGRVNPAGIPVLYLGSTPETAISEIRPWVGAEVSVARFRVTRDLRVVNLTQSPPGTMVLAFSFNDEPVPPDHTEKAVWSTIDNAFSTPVTRSDDSAEYVPTQILAELFRDAGYDGLIYHSQFGGEHGYNIVLFNLDDAEALDCAPHRVKGLEVQHEFIGYGHVKRFSKETN